MRGCTGRGEASGSRECCAHGVCGAKVVIVIVITRVSRSHTIQLYDTKLQGIPLKPYTHAHPHIRLRTHTPPVDTGALTFVACSAPRANTRNRHVLKAQRVTPSRTKNGETCFGTNFCSPPLARFAPVHSARSREGPQTRARQRVRTDCAVAACASEWIAERGIERGLFTTTDLGAEHIL